MKVSIITISYNQSMFLEKAIKSVLNQDYQNIEYIIVDAGSTDGSRDIINIYKDKLSKFICEPDKGPADGLNKGFRAATGNICGFLNADDYLLPGAVSSVVNEFKKTDADVISGHCFIVDEKEKVLRKLYSDNFSLLGSAYGFSRIVQPSTFFKRSTYELANGFNINNRSNWDDELFIDMKQKRAKYSITHSFLSAYRVHENSITGSKNLNKKIKEYTKYRFSKIMQRDRKWYDHGFEIFFRILRILKQPRHIFEKLKSGKIYGSYS